MEHLIKVAQHGTRLEKIAAIVDELSQARNDYEAAEVLAIAEEMGIPSTEIEQAIPLFKEASAAMYNPTEELVKVATQIVDDPYATPLEKVAAMVDGVVAGAFDPEAVYGAAAELGFAPEDVDFIYETAYLGKTAAEDKKPAPKTEGGEEAWYKKMGRGILDAYKFKDIREGWAEGSKEGGKRNWTRIAKGAGKSGLAYGVPAGAAYYAYRKYKDRDEDR